MFSKLMKLFKKETKSDFEGLSTGKVKEVGEDESIFPVRKNDSLMDGFKTAAREGFERGEFGEVTVHESWNYAFKNRSPNIPYYTAFNGVPSIVVLISEEGIQKYDVIGKAIENQWQPALFFKAFLGGEYPILRAVFCFRDVPENPLMLESPLDIRDGDVQDFYNALQSYSKLDLIIKHTQNMEHCYAVSCTISNKLKDTLKQEVKMIVKVYKKGAEGKDFKKAVEKMEMCYTSASDGVSMQKNTIDIPISGEAKNKLLKYEENIGS